MKLTKSFESGLAIMLLIARQSPNGPITARQLAKQLNTSVTYSQKLLRKLVVAELVKSAPGNCGGFTLAREASKITLADIVTALDGNQPSFQPSDLVNRATGNTATTTVITQPFRTADLVWLQVLNQTTLSALIN